MPITPSAEIFAAEGKLAFLAAMAQAAYDLRIDSDTGDGVNTTEVVADDVNNPSTSGTTAARTLVTGYTAALGKAELPSLAPVASGDQNFPSTGLESGVFTSANAAALVTAGTDVLFIAFRGTNDYGDLSDLLFGSPDSNQWSTSGKADHYALFASLRTAIDTYLTANPQITKVFVTGHSLGGAMAHAYMAEHAGDTRFEAVTFGSIGYGTGPDAADPRITNFVSTNDIARTPLYLDRTDGDDNETANGILSPTVAHSIGLYLAEMQFLRANGVDAAVVNGTSDFDRFIFQSVQVTADTFAVGIEDDTLRGTSAAEYILGGLGNDLLDGGSDSVSDTLAGGSGNDLYVVRTTTDIIIEAAGNGTADNVQSDVSFTLAAGVSIERLETTNSFLSTAINLTGNAFQQSIFGNRGTNILNGGVDNLADTLTGYSGNDIYIINTSTDVIVEGSGEGTLDRARVSVTFVLAADDNIEALETANPLTTTAIKLTGNNIAQTITGNAGNNALLGREGNDKLIAGAGSDILNGGAGIDSLAGQAGRDVFVFNAALNSATNRDTINDFLAADDVFYLENTGAGLFNALTTGALAASAFVANGTGTATDALDRIVYNTSTGVLSYDANGNAAGGAVQFALLTNKAAITHLDFLVV